MAQRTNPVRRLGRAVKGMVRRAVQQRVTLLTKLQPTTEFDDEDVFLVGYPKSGNTWLQNLVSGVLYGVDPALTPDTVIQELVPDIHYKAYYKRFSTPMCFKSHFLPRPEYRHVIYLTRDGRDAMVSYYHFNQARGQGVSYVEMLRQRRGISPCQWHEHVLAWLSPPAVPELLWIRYEDLKASPVLELERICDALGVSRSNSFLRHVAEAASFEAMRRKEDRSGWDNPNWPSDQHFVRRGKVGSYRDEMPTDVLREFEAMAGPALELCGYALSAQEARH